MGRLADRDSAAREQREMPNGSNAADFSEALARGLAVLTAFNGERRRLTQADLARELGLSRATVRRAVLTLEHLGYLVADGRVYELTPRVLHLAESYLTANTVSMILQPVCDRICARWRQSCAVAVLEGPDAVMIARSVPNRLIAVGSGIGYRVPAAASALGKVLLAHLGPDGPTAGSSGDGLDAGEKETVRRDGYSYVANDVEAGFHSIAVPVRRWDGLTVAALNLGCNTESIPPESMRSDVLADLLTETEQLERQLV